MLHDIPSLRFFDVNFQGWPKNPYRISSENTEILRFTITDDRDKFKGLVRATFLGVKLKFNLTVTAFWCADNIKEMYKIMQRVQWYPVLFGVMET